MTPTNSSSQEDVLHQKLVFNNRKNRNYYLAGKSEKEQIGKLFLQKWQARKKRHPNESSEEDIPIDEEQEKAKAPGVLPMVHEKNVITNQKHVKMETVPAQSPLNKKVKPEFQIDLKASSKQSHHLVVGMPNNARSKRAVSRDATAPSSKRLNFIQARDSLGKTTNDFTSRTIESRMASTRTGMPGERTKRDELPFKNSIEVPPGSTQITAR